MVSILRNAEGRLRVVRRYRFSITARYLNNCDSRQPQQRPRWKADRCLPQHSYRDRRRTPLARSMLLRIRRHDGSGSSRALRPLAHYEARQSENRRVFRSPHEPLDREKTNCPLADALKPSASLLEQASSPSLPNLLTLMPAAPSIQGGTHRQGRSPFGRIDGFTVGR